MPSDDEPPSWFMAVAVGVLTVILLSAVGAVLYVAIMYVNAFLE